jgi:hypothetical protein
MQWLTLQRHHATPERCRMNSHVERIGISTILTTLYKTMSYKILQKQIFLLKSNTCEFCVDTNTSSVGIMLHKIKRAIAK